MPHKNRVDTVMSVSRFPILKLYLNQLALLLIVIGLLALTFLAGSPSNVGTYFFGAVKNPYYMGIQLT